MNGKGDTPRPLSVTQAELSDRWAQTFGGRSAPWDRLCPTCNGQQIQWVRLGGRTQYDHGVCYTCQSVIPA